MKALSLCFLVLSFLGNPRAFSATAVVSHRHDFFIPEDSQSAGGGFIVPNEEEFWRFGQSLAGKTGALVGVGTFRMFYDASQGDFSEVFLLDYAKEVTEFNHSFIDLLKISKDRLDFLALLSGDRNLRDSFERFENANRARKSWVNDFNLHVHFSFGEEHPYLKLETIHEGLASRAALNFVTKVFSFYADPKMDKQSFLHSDGAFAKIKKLADEGRFHVIHGSLSGSVSMASLASSLLERKLEVSIIDISNAYVPIMDFGGEKAFVRNLQMLPFSKDGLVLFTHSARTYSDDGWSYYAIPQAEYKTAAASFSSQLNAGSSYTRFVYGLDAAGRAIEKSTCRLILQ